MDKDLTFRLITPDGTVKDQLCRGVYLTACEGTDGKGGGSMGILYGHLPAVAALEEPSAVRIVFADGNEEIIKVQGGFAQVDNNTVTVISEKAGR